MSSGSACETYSTVLQSVYQEYKNSISASSARRDRSHPPTKAESDLYRVEGYDGEQYS